MHVLKKHAHYCVEVDLQIYYIKFLFGPNNCMIDPGYNFLNVENGVNWVSGVLA